MKSWLAHRSFLIININNIICIYTDKNSFEFDTVSLIFNNILDFFLSAGNILEIGAQHSIEVKDIPAFERYMAQLKCYYLDYKDKVRFLILVYNGSENNKWSLVQSFSLKTCKV